MDILAKLFIDVILAASVEQTVLQQQSINRIGVPVIPATNINAQLEYTKKEFASVSSK